MDAVGALRELWLGSAGRLAKRLHGLTDEEFFWEPAQPAWSVRPDPVAPSGWQIDYAFPPPVPAPITTIAWRLVHLAVVTNSYTDYAFGAATHDFDDDVIPGDPAGAIAWWQQTAETFANYLAKATDADLEAPRTFPFNSYATTLGSAVRIVVNETTHHGAEIGCLRDLLRVLP